MRLVDASSYQGRPDWLRAHREGKIVGAWLKATEGRTVTDREFALSRRRATAAGVRVGAYHFAHPEINRPETEAAHFCAEVGELRRTDLRPVLDYETNTHLTVGQNLRWIQVWNRIVKDRLGVWPVFYSYPAMIQHLGLKAPVGGGLWLASYATNDGREHGYIIPRPWRKVVAHQFTSRGHVPGFDGPVDVTEAARLLPLLAFPARGLL